MYTREDSKKQLLEKGILVKPSEAEEYCKDTKLKFQKLENGTTFFGIQKMVEDSENTNLELQYNFGAYCDPAEKLGMTHLLEHLWFSEKFNKSMIENHVNKNGWTSSRALNMSIGGIWNEKYSLYSLPSVLDEVLHNFFHHDNIKSKQNLNIEIDVVNREIAEADTDFFKYSIREKFLPFILPGHELNVNVLGKSNTLADISLEDLKKFTKEKFTTTNSYVKLFVEGEDDKLSRVSDQLFERLGKVETSDLLSPMIPEYIFDENNFPKGDFRLDTDGKFRERVMGIILFPIRLTIPDRLNYALSHFESRFNDDLFVKIRKNGLAYSASILNLRINSEYILFGAHFVSTKDKITEILPKFTKEFFNVFEDYVNDPKLLEREVELESLRQKASPILKQSILEDSANMYLEYGYLSNIYKYRELISSISVHDLLEFSNIVTKAKTTNILVGDLD